MVERVFLALNLLKRLLPFAGKQKNVTWSGKPYGCIGGILAVNQSVVNLTSEMEPTVKKGGQRMFTVVGQPEISPLKNGCRRIEC